MYNKGIYFADIASKAANYSSENQEAEEGLLLLCEVALGRSQDHYHAKNNLTGIPSVKYQSVRARGRTYPTENVKIDGVNVAANNSGHATYSTALQYNEYVIIFLNCKQSDYNTNGYTFQFQVVYDETQVRIKYLVKVQFNYH